MAGATSGAKLRTRTAALLNSRCGHAGTQLRLAHCGLSSPLGNILRDTLRFAQHGRCSTVRGVATTPKMRTETETAADWLNLDRAATALFVRCECDNDVSDMQQRGPMAFSAEHEDKLPAGEGLAGAGLGAGGRGVRAVAPEELPEGLFIVPNFLSEERHDLLADAAARVFERRPASTTGTRPMDLGRRCVEFGPPFPLPQIFQREAVQLFREAGLVGPRGPGAGPTGSRRQEIDYLAINEYVAPGGIESHVDEYTDASQILTLSLLEDCVMELEHRPDGKIPRKIPPGSETAGAHSHSASIGRALSLGTRADAELPLRPLTSGGDSRGRGLADGPRRPSRLRLLLPLRSLLVMRGAARWHWAHGISFGHTHAFDPGREVRRARRLSLTFLLHPQ